MNILIFYGFKKNGRPLINNTYFYSIELNPKIENKEKRESESLVIKESGNNTFNKEYVISISKKFSFVEIYDFENEIIYKKDINKFAKIEYNIHSYRHALIPLYSNDTNYYYLFSFINNQSRYIIQKHLINAYNSEFILINNFIFNSNTNEKNPFYKCLHFKNNIGLFAYYDNSFPVLLFLEYEYLFLILAELEH